MSIILSKDDTIYTITAHENNKGMTTKQIRYPKFGNTRCKIAK